MPDMDWRLKDDDDLTSEDIDAMIAEGTPVAARGPRLPGGARLITAAPASGGQSTTVRPGGGVVRVGAPVCA